MSDHPTDPGSIDPHEAWRPPEQPPPTHPQVPPTTGGPTSPAEGFAAAAMPSTAETKGFFTALFDLSFSRFITPMIIKFVYVLMMIVIVIVYLFYAILLFQAGATSIGVLWLLVVGPIASILWLAIARMTLEFYLAVVRVSEDVHRAVGGGGR
jgi:hypothetical protein